MYPHVLLKRLMLPQLVFIHTVATVKVALNTLLDAYANKTLYKYQFNMKIIQTSTDTERVVLSIETKTNEWVNVLVVERGRWLVCRHKRLKIWKLATSWTAT